jgi:hypothetical protein
MVAKGDKDNGNRPKEYYPETQKILDRLRDDPTIAFECSHGGEPAVGIYEVPRGCVALPGLETQALCPHHIISNGSFEGMFPVVDLSINAAWSVYRREEPDYCIMEDTASGDLILIPFANRYQQSDAASEETS